MTAIDYTHFIVIDDESLNNLICKKLTKITFPSAEIKTFTDPEAGLSYLKSNYTTSAIPKTLLFLDINMPSMSGWEFMDEFERFDPSIKEHIDIYILSSSVDPSDKKRAQMNPYILGFIEKPLTRDWLKSL
jgi:two-component SAPR family response regulator